jgi:hypothetical protein
MVLSDMLPTTGAIRTSHALGRNTTRLATAAGDPEDVGQVEEQDQAGNGREPTGAERPEGIARTAGRR